MMIFTTHPSALRSNCCYWAGRSLASDAGVQVHSKLRVKAAERDTNDLIMKGILSKEEGGRRGASYSLPI